MLITVLINHNILWITVDNTLYVDLLVTLWYLIDVK